jgi:hypothetical protein
MGSFLWLAIAMAVLSTGCGSPEDESALVLRVGPPSGGATVEAAAGVVRSRLAGLGVEGTVTVDGDLLRLDVPPGVPGSPLVGVLTDQRHLRILVVPAEAPPDAEVVDPSWELLLEATGPVPATVGSDAGGGPAISFAFTGADAERLAEHTTTHVGEAMALVLSDDILAMPIIQAPIADGRMVVTLGSEDWSPDRLQELVGIVSSGPLPAPVVEDAGG